MNRHEPLYLKYRPQSLAELVGQDAVTRTLTNAITYNRLSHAYLFTGPRGTGKTSSARILAKSLNCKKSGGPTSEPCQVCSCCEEITAGSSPAVLEIDAASNNSVDDARILIERAPLVAVGGEFKVYIIDECHMLSKEAFNALLKTIEQPPPQVVFILATTEEHKVLPTIVSRCQRLMFRLIPQEPLFDHLRNVAQKEQIEIDDEALRLIGRRSGGGLRDALGHLDQASLLSAPGNPVTVSDLLRLFGALNEDLLLNISRQILLRDGQGIIDSVNTVLEQGREPAVVVQELSRHFLNLLKASYLSGAAGQEQMRELILGSSPYLAGLAELAPQFERAELSQIVEAFDRLEVSCRRTTQPAMHLEIGLLSVCHRQDMLLIKELSERVSQLERALEQGAPAVRPLSISPPQAASAVKQPVKLAASAGTTPQYSAREAIKEPEIRTEPIERPVQSLAEPVLAEPVRAVEPDVLITEEPREQLPEPLVAPAPAAEISNKPAPLDLSESGAPEESLGDIDHLWSQVLDELQRRHIPTFSLASTHAFPLTMNSQEVSLGVMKETFQKMLEQKIDHLKAACQEVTGKPVNVRVRVTSEASPLATSRDSAQKAVSSARPPEPAKEQSFPSRTEPQAQARAQDKDPESTAREEGSPATERGEFDSTMVKEAYKLFDGPGSRRIQ